MSKRCEYCGDELTPGHASFGICGWCIKEIEDSQKLAKEYQQPTYFSGDRDEYKVEGEIDYG